MRIVFMGTPDFAVATLDALNCAGHEIVGVYCQPDKPVGRKQVLTPPPVKAYALAHSLPVFQPTTFKDDAAYEQLRALAPDIIAVVAYGKILPQRVLVLPTLGCINGHGSLLPRYRGASPIQWAVVKGEKVTGITTMYMDIGMDTGDILETVTTEIGENETADELFERLSPLCAELMTATVKKAENGMLHPQKQDETKATYAPLIRKEMGLLDFTKPAAELYNLIRGFNSWPVAYFLLDGKRVKVYSSFVGGKTNAVPGTVVTAGQSISVACGDGTVLSLTDVQHEGAKRMSAEMWINGHKLATGTVLRGEE